MTNFELPYKTNIKEGMELLVTGSPFLSTFSYDQIARNGWEKTFLYKMVVVLETEDYKDGLIRVQLCGGKKTITYLHKSLLLDIGVRL